MGVFQFNIVPLIFPKKDFDMGKLPGKLSYLPSIFDKRDVNKEKAFFNDLVKRFRVGIENWESYKPVRSLY
ncbi:MAG: hypothetical protein ACXQTO_01605 [Candidatus Syntropharchaeales archaeon]